MKKLLLIAALAVFACSGLRAQNNGVQFEDASMKVLLAKAKKENKLLFVDVYASWCGPCKRMAGEVFTQKKVGDYFNANFINAKFDAEKGEGIDVAKKYNVRAYPTFLILDHTGNQVGVIIGGDDADPFIKSVKDVVEKANQ